ncbi:putative bifunctional diguanylate cyclase/phosphodiesterase [Solilutibacter tolerans]|uniref:Diguanylate cyclase/phosphodiesterase n=1 Tax=Solilutibacter tolerans TaxID=1604334 RepID=A0A1N6NYX6_9GAMM|nr:EAL domain-containing protein [Lysobacter tolerans]SIP97250.1 diguanylate cyclase/phosphodiesterase [Lysobacter tolerans]
MRLPRLGVQGQLLVMLAILLSAVALLVALLMQRQAQMHSEVTEFSRTAMQQMIQERVRNRAQSRIVQLSEALTNPVYYFDLENIGDLANSAKREPDVEYVLVYDLEGRVLHDGSGEISTYGQLMQDPLAAKAVAAKDSIIQLTPRVLDVAAPIRVGDQQLGGVRIGYSLASARDTEARSIAELDRKVGEVASRNRLPIYILVGLMMLLAVASALAVQRRLVGPILRLSRYAQEIEAGHYDIDVQGSRRTDEVGELERAFARMSSSVRAHDSEIREIAFTDALTRLPNRRDFRERLDQRLQTQGEDDALALLFIDLDDFKRVNDTLGHETGDRVLVEVSSRIRKLVAQNDLRNAELSRFGGDEFVILVESREAGVRGVSSTAAKLAQSLVTELAKPIQIDESEHVFLGASIGITLFPSDAASAVTLIKNGDIAMYQAKTAGKHCYRFYHPSMEQVVERRVRMEKELRTAWERDELTMYYQPVFRMSDRQIVGAEALLRWQHPEYGVVAPSVFIAVAEETGLIEQLGPHVIRKACIDAMRWRAVAPKYTDLFVSVNLSVRQLRDAWLPEQVGEILKSTGMSPEGLHLELTETVVLDDAIDSRGLMRRLRDAGVKLWLDDFGTGFSGLSHLRRLPVDGVKIDRTFVSDILHDADDRALTRAIIGMAQSLGIVVIAEGIEEQGQYELLRETGCDLGQGYLLGKPMDQQSFLKLLR